PRFSSLGESGADLSRAFGDSACIPLMRSQDAILQHIRCLEGHHPARQDRHFFAGLRIATDALVLFTDMKGRKGRELGRFAAYNRLADLFKDHLDELCGLGTGKTHLPIYGFSEIGTRDCLSPHPAVQPSQNLKKYLRL